MEQESDLAKRRAAYQALLRDVGKQLSTLNTDSIEFSENVPEDDRGKTGIKLLEHLQNKGRFSLWRTEPLRDVLRSCDRCDLANGLVKDYQLCFPDTGIHKGAGLMWMCVIFSLSQILLCPAIVHPASCPRQAKVPFSPPDTGHKMILKHLVQQPRVASHLSHLHPLSHLNIVVMTSHCHRGKKIGGQI